MSKKQNISLTECAKMAGKEWYNLGEIQRKQYNEQSQKEWNEFRKKIEQYRKNNGYMKWKIKKQGLPKKMYYRSPSTYYVGQNWPKYSKWNKYNKYNKLSNKQILNVKYYIFSKYFDFFIKIIINIQILIKQWINLDDSAKDWYKMQFIKQKNEFISKYGIYLKYSQKSK